MYVKTLQHNSKITLTIELPNQTPITIEQHIKAVRSDKRTVIAIDAPKSVKIQTQ